MINRYYHSRKIQILLIPVLLLVSACTAIGPPTVARDRFDYVNAMSDSWKRQMLLNLVKTRYMDAPVFLDVASIISQYSVEGKIALGAYWSTAYRRQPDDRWHGTLFRSPHDHLCASHRCSLYPTTHDPYPGGGDPGAATVRLSGGFRVPHRRANHQRRQQPLRGTDYAARCGSGILRSHARSE